MYDEGPQDAPIITPREQIAEFTAVLSNQLKYWQDRAMERATALKEAERNAQYAATAINALQSTTDQLTSAKEPYGVSPSTQGFPR